MRYIASSLRRFVVERANSRCEYCGLSQAGQVATFHINHIIPMATGGETIAENLALACVSCSLRKSAREMIVDPDTNQLVPIYHPRQQAWAEHFGWDGLHISGQTATGRATVAVLKLNRPLMLAIREEEKLLGRHPA